MLFKHAFKLDKQSLITELRLGCHNLSIETCRPKVQRHNRVCHFCPDIVESEGQFILHRSKHDSIRNKGKFIIQTTK